MTWRIKICFSLFEAIAFSSSNVTFDKASLLEIKQNIQVAPAGKQFMKTDDGVKKFSRTS